MTNLKALKQQAIDMEAKLKEMKAEIERMENGWEMKYQYKLTDGYWFILSDGDIKPDKWINCEMDKERLIAGNVFPTKEAAELESKRRKLLTRFRAFKDECNGDWKVDWSDSFKAKHYLEIIDSKVVLDSVNYANRIATFGYFKNESDAERAIELFGDEIKELFMEV